MSDLVAIIRATQRSVLALSRASRWAREVSDACATLEHNARQLASGKITPAAAAMGDRIASARKTNAMAKHARAMRSYAAAQRVLATNPLPGDTI